MSRLQSDMALKRKRGEQASLIKSLGDVDREILDIIKSREDLGISMYEIKRVLSKPHPQFNKSIKLLTTGQLIKEVPNIKNRGGKHYMAAEFEPSKELTGGAWYVDGKLDKAYIAETKDICSKVVRKLNVASAEGVYDFMKKNKVLKEISLQQVEEILRSLVLDNVILEVKSTGLAEYHSIPVGEVCYRCPSGGALGHALETGAFTSIPCGVCPRISMCTPDGVISPATCNYYKKWLDGIEF